MQQLAALLITRQVIGNIKEALVPFIIEKLKLFKIGFKMAEAMSPETLERQMKNLAEGKDNFAADTSADAANDRQQDPDVSGDGNDEVVAADEMEFPLLPGDKVEKRKFCNEEMEVVHSGMTLSQAEVEAAMKKVMLFF